MAHHKMCRMKKQSTHALIIIWLLLLAVSCQPETAGQEMTNRATFGSEPVDPAPTIQEEAPGPSKGTRTENLAGNELSPSGLRAWLEIPSSLSLGGPVQVQFFLTNETGSNLYILNWFTPLEGLGGDIFRVTRDGRRVPYQGPLASRGDPTPEAYTLLEAGETAQAEVDLSLAYDFSLPGNYTIEFVSPKLSHIARTEEEMARSMNELGPVELPSNEVMVAIGI